MLAIEMLILSETYNCCDSIGHIIAESRLSESMKIIQAVHLKPFFGTVGDSSSRAEKGGKKEKKHIFVKYILT